MGQYQYVILSLAVPGRETEFETWYDHQHLTDVLNVDGVSRARRYRVKAQKATGVGGLEWQSLAIYDIESDAPHNVIAAISQAANTPAMPVSEALAKTGLVQLLVEKVSDVETPTRKPERAHD